MSFTNGHVMIGYKDPRSYVPLFPLKMRKGGQWGNSTEVIDSRNYIMATFRNFEDAEPYIDTLTKRYNAGRAEYERKCALTPPEDGKTPCPVCSKRFAGLRPHMLAKHNLTPQKFDKFIAA